MPRVCTVCTHPDRPAIDMALVNHRPYRNIAAQFRLSPSALVRHHDEHLPATLAKAHAADETAAALDVMAELRRCFERVNLLFDACDRWLRDADDPARYDLGPLRLRQRGRQVLVVVPLDGALRDAEASRYVPIALPVDQRYVDRRAVRVGADRAGSRHQLARPCAVDPASICS